MDREVLSTFVPINEGWYIKAYQNQLECMYVADNPKPSKAEEQGYDWCQLGSYTANHYCHLGNFSSVEQAEKHLYEKVLKDICKYANHHYYDPVANKNNDEDPYKTTPILEWAGAKQKQIWANDMQRKWVRESFIYGCSMEDMVRMHSKTEDEIYDTVLDKLKPENAAFVKERLWKEDYSVKFNSWGAKSLKDEYAGAVGMSQVGARNTAWLHNRDLVLTAYFMEGIDYYGL